LNAQSGLDAASEERSSRAGFFFALSAFIFWGLMALYWKATAHINPGEVTAHRVLWAVPAAGLFLWVTGRTGDILPTFKSRRKLAILFFTSILISFNWGIFIWAISVERTLEAAMAYYINPLMSVAMGVLFLRERFDVLQLIAIGLAGLAVIILTIMQGELPWISLALALTFALYGLIRKTVDVGPAQGFFVEVSLIFPVALGYLAYLAFTGALAFGNTGLSDSLLFVFAGPATAIPLVLYASGAKRLRLSTIGMMQYLAPTIIFLIGIFVFKETLKPSLVIAFVLIWSALAVYSLSMFRASGQKKTT
jgi:chloramphenicol-sensitive protein RarD